MEAYPTKVRELVLGAYDQGMGTKDIAETFEVSPSWARRVRQRLREQGLRTAIRQKHGPAPKLGVVHRQYLAELVQETPDATLSQLHEQLSLPVSVSTVARALTAMKLTLKKSPRGPRNKTGPT